MSTACKPSSKASPRCRWTDDRPPFRHVGVIECRGPGPRHRLRVMGSAAEHVGRRHDDQRLPTGANEAGIEIGQKRALATSCFGRLVPSLRSAPP